MKKDIKKIFHISDLHTRLYYRGKEYKQVLEKVIQFYENIQNLSECLTIITGDIFHFKTQLSPQAISIVIQYLTTISKYTPVIVISGNHDANLSNKNRLDSISPIVKAINRQNIIYYRDTGWYEFRNLNIYVCSVFDETLPPKDFVYPQDSICLYHGIVANPKLDNKFMLTSKKFNIKDFQKFKYVLLGDIHKHQIMSYNNPIMAYAGSMIQANYGQSPQNHGILIWDLQSDDLELRQIENNYSFYNVIVNDGDIIYCPEIKAKYAKIKIKHSNTSLTRLQEIKQQFKKKYTPYQINVFSQNDVQRIKKSAQMVYEIQNIKDINFQETLLSEYNDKTNIASKNDLKKVFNINKKFNEQLKAFKGIHQTHHCSLKSLYFDNFLSYGQNNYINFEEYNGLVGLIGENAVGKSSIISILLFMMFDISPNVNRAYSLLNKNNDSKRLYGKLEFYVDGVLYTIEKQGNLNKNQDHIPIQIKFYKIIDDEVIDLSGKERSDTKSIISSFIGYYGDCVTTNIAIQNQSLGFIQLKNTARKDFLNNMLNLNIFDSLYNLANDEYKDLNSILNNYGYESLVSQKTNLDEKLIELKSLITQNNKQLKENREIQKIIKKKLELCTTQIKNLPNELIQIDVKEHKLCIENLIKESQNLNKNIHIKKESKKKLILEMQSINKQLIENMNKYECNIERKQQLDKYMKQLVNLQNQKRILQMKLQEDGRQLKILQTLEYDENCPYCMNNPLTKDVLNKKDSYDKDENILYKLKDTINMILCYQKQYNQLIQFVKKYQERISQVQKLLKLKSQITMDISLLQQKDKNCEIAIKQYQKQLNQYITNQNIVKNNVKLLKQIKEYKLQLENVILLIRKLQNNNMQTSIDVGINENSLKKIKKDINSCKKLSKQIYVLQIYKQFICRNGIQYYIISNMVSILENEVNNVLQLITNFTVEFVLDGKNVDIQLRGKNMNHNVSTCSGFEKFIISIAMRYALSKITNLCKYDFFIIDQGFGVIDTINLGELQNVLQFLSDKFKIIVIISHMDLIKSYMEQYINVQKNQLGESFVK